MEGLAYAPFYEYTMKQAIEEKFILDVVRKAPMTGWAPRPDEEETDGGYLAAAKSGGEDGE